MWQLGVSPLATPHVTRVTRYTAHLAASRACHYTNLHNLILADGDALADSCALGGEILEDNWRRSE